MYRTDIWITSKETTIKVFDTNLGCWYTTLQAKKMTVATW